MELIICYTLKKACFRAVNKHMRSSKDNYPNGKEKITTIFQELPQERTYVFTQTL